MVKEMKSPYSRQELKHFKKLLEHEHEETKDKIEKLKSSVADITGNDEDESSASAHHQADIGSEEDEREKFLIMIEKENEKITQINDALNRIEAGSYGICEKSGSKIQKERLEAIPYARYSVEVEKNKH